MEKFKIFEANNEQTETEYKISGCNKNFLIKKEKYS